MQRKGFSFIKDVIQITFAKENNPCKKIKRETLPHSFCFFPNQSGHY
ncbi:hypothetical protein M076_0380 [Bacteroides fragilis str. 2-F-2 |uniref:Uncharacterized protein n=1 Tax=Bacteroides fragilis str. 2-F-2 \|nr:hypothetical protein M077_0375 [Bacteroides fragilis str. 2-F-2 \